MLLLVADVQNYCLFIIFFRSCKYRRSTGYISLLKPYKGEIDLLYQKEILKSKPVSTCGRQKTCFEEIVTHLHSAEYPGKVQP